MSDSKKTNLVANAEESKKDNQTNEFEVEADAFVIRNSTVEADAFNEIENHFEDFGSMCFSSVVKAPEEKLPIEYHEPKEEAEAPLLSASTNPLLRSQRETRNSRDVSQEDKEHRGSIIFKNPVISRRNNIHKPSNLIA